ncbi:MAG: AcrR family transcriptional regulator [Hyphomicrobiaceae bacterium]|jgi:AcrR family transcriptional regulator
MEATQPQTAAKPRNNRDRIIEATVALLNEFGEAGVGTGRISQVLGISPGNLYYHFKNRQEIVRAIFPRIESGLEAALTPAPDADGAELLARHYMGGFRIMYEYRFFFCGLPQLLGSDDELRRDYLRLEAASLLRIRSIIETSLAYGQPPRRPTPVELEQVTTNTWMVFLSWLNFVCLRKSSAEVAFDDVASGLQHVFGLLAPWLDDSYSRSVASELERMFQIEKQNQRAGSL